jgi:hypothetical protein
MEEQKTAKRKSLTKKVRFEVFKRDNFTCQYCGAKAPDVVLEIDHIDPHAKGGSCDVINLLTSCFECNRGKSDRKLSDMSVVEKQRVQIEELNLRRQQLEMILEWKTGLNSINDESIIKVKSYIEELVGYKFKLTDSGEKKLKSSIKKFGVSEIIDCVDIAFDKYFFSGDDDSFDVAFNKIGAIANNRSKPEYLQKIAYNIGILKNRIYVNHAEATRMMVDYYEAGYSMDQLTMFCKEVKHWTKFKEWINSIYDVEGEDGL